MGLRCLAVGAVAAAPEPAGAQSAGPAQSVPAERTFRDWVVGCDNGRGCIALGMVPADDLNTAFIHVQREAGRGARPVVSIVLYDDSGETPGGRQIHLTIDGATIEGVASRRLAEAVPDFPGFLQATLSDNEVAPLVAALRRGSQLSIAIDGGAAADISLAGAMAALLFIDDVQGRVDSVGALARSGRRLASAVPEPPSLPLILAQPAPEGTGVDPRRAEAVTAGWARQAVRDCALDEPDVGRRPRPSGRCPAAAFSSASAAAAAPTTSIRCSASSSPASRSASSPPASPCQRSMAPARAAAARA